MKGTLSLRSAPPRSHRLNSDAKSRETNKQPSAYPPKHKPKRNLDGHEVPLVTMCKDSAIAELTLNSGITVRGICRGFDRYSVTLEIPSHPYPLTYFKSSIERFTRVSDEMAESLHSGTADWEVDYGEVQ